MKETFCRIYLWKIISRLLTCAQLLPSSSAKDHCGNGCEFVAYVLLLIRFRSKVMVTLSDLKWIETCSKFLDIENSHTTEDLLKENFRDVLIEGDDKELFLFIIHTISCLISSKQK